MATHDHSATAKQIRDRIIADRNRCTIEKPTDRAFWLGFVAACKDYKVIDDSDLLYLRRYIESKWSTV